MKKPKIKKRETFDWFECVKYVEHKLGYKLRDTLGKFGGDNYVAKVEYRDFWHFVLESADIHNGCEFYLPDDSEIDWQKEILAVFHEEFGVDALYWVAW